MHFFSETRHHTDGSLSSNLGGQPYSKHSTQPHSHLGRPEPHPVIGDVTKPSNKFEKTSVIVRVVWLKQLCAVSLIYYVRVVSKTTSGRIRNTVQCRRHKNGAITDYRTVQHHAMRHGAGDCINILCPLGTAKFIHCKEHQIEEDYVRKHEHKVPVFQDTWPVTYMFLLCCTYRMNK